MFFKCFIISKVMRTRLFIVFTLFLTCSLNLCKVFGQTVVTGRIFAEVVEKVSASSAAVTDLSLKKKDVNNTLSQPGEVNLNQGVIDLGAIEVRSGKGVVCDVIIEPAKLSDTKGNAFTIDPVIQNSGLTELLPTDGHRTIQLNGTAPLLNQQASGQYQGFYSIVLAFN